MPVRLAACDPCRLSKVSCDHQRPVCGRCSESGPENCQYRERPFKRRRGVPAPQELRPAHISPLAEPVGVTVTAILPTTLVNDSPATSTSTPHVYPNPGYQGQSSHATIFDTVKASGAADVFASHDGLNEAMGELEESEASQHARFLDDLKKLDLDACAQLVRHWTSCGVNLAVASELLLPCADAICVLFQNRSGTELASLLFRSSRERLTADGTMTIPSFCDTFCRNDPGWATLGLFLVAVSRAVEDTAFFPGLYSTRAGQRQLAKTLLRCSDQCLDICLSLDCLNDLQLVLQYEVFIAHSMIDGDQSYHSWRRLGDVISTLYALGHHERVSLNTMTSNSLASLRGQTFARAYSADKNVSIFLGRPHRMHSAHSTLKMSPGEAARLFGPPTQFEYRLETLWTVACAMLKERILDLARSNNSEARARATMEIHQECEALTIALPARYRLEDNLKAFEGTAVERDFVASAALNLLHVRFLLHSASMARTSDPSDDLLSVSGAMLKLAAEVAVLKESLANSGTGFIWKIASYGLPAAGVICLALVNRTRQRVQTTFSTSQAIQDLSVLVAHVEAGVLIRPDQPNYALLQGATATIKSVLGRVSQGLLGTTQRDVRYDQMLEDASTAEPWTMLDSDTLDFELDFWTNLAEHPALYQDIT
ncbi:Putative zn(2)-C6 fungal-type DNA-binding domain-containing protein [Septoria linicola]|uniref:Zn(2)-C6 fungal-type DNA-binding domain-containing protein n=1 Tax=Septoria linicola TaxID=215465 RepID=A0A9Q9B5J3_9PEZI|nr:putative zn(2)-C6 fungal-type DNA-binding domain-containing protein [Septoria linicola]USW58630.1 Putative zn(2)-C6 fungal-type DNA-binding domain-containing protein [Septoria linicola]